ncbi:unnamed protein product [Hymenolepis diminuta]|uniref:Uncharacterized protein n=1 Tax=Hymenolepis diminuta TaxID=6216 RepID=A0A564YE45_HYMDI|nr:unnamed protein product [Hymenolepis diminuta]
MSKRTHRFPPYSNRFVSPKSTSVTTFSRVLTQVIPIKLPLFSTQKRIHACQLLAPALSAHPLSSSARSSLSLSPTRFRLVASLNKSWSYQLSVFCSTIIVNYKLVTVIAVVIC